MELLIGDTSIGTVVNAKRSPQAQKMVTSALDGSTYVQTTGGRIMRYIVDVYCSTLAKRESLDSACNEGTLLTIVFGENSSANGYVEENEVSWKEWRDGHAVGRFTMIME